MLIETLKICAGSFHSFRDGSTGQAGVLLLVS